MTEPTEAELLAAFRSAVAHSTPTQAREALRERWLREDRVFAAAQHGAYRAESDRVLRRVYHNPNHWG